MTITAFLGQVRWRWPVLTLFVLPWSVLAIGDQPGIGVELVFVWGLLDLPSRHWFTLPEYVFAFTGRLPARLLAWPIGSLTYLGALVSALSGSLLDREDPRVTAGLLVLSGLNCLWFTGGIAQRNTATILAVPLGTLLMWFVAWWSYWPKIAGER